MYIYVCTYIYIYTYVHITLSLTQGYTVSFSSSLTNTHTHTVLYINVGGAQDFWFTADEKCVPGGPGFDYTYYNTYTSVVGAFTGWFGIVIFQVRFFLKFR